MTIEMIFVLFLLVAAVILFATGKIPIDISACIVMVVPLPSGILTLEEGIAGFNYPATVFMPKFRLF